MKKFLWLTTFFVVGNVFADGNLTSRVQVTTTSTTDLMYKLEGPGGANADRSIAIGDLQKDLVISSVAVGAVVPASLSAGTYSNATIPAANVAAGSLGSSVIASSIAVAAVNVAQMNFSGTPSATTFASGNGSWATPAGGGGGSASIAVGTGTASNFTTSVTSPTAVFSYLGSQFNLLASGTTIFIAANPSTFTMLGNTIPLATNVSGRLPQSNQTFTMILDPIRAKLLSPGTTNFPSIDNSTTTAIQSLYWVDGTTQTVSWTQVLQPYGGGNIVADFTFSGATVTSGNVNWSVFVKCNGAGHQVSVDSIFQSYSLDVSTGGAIPGTAGLPGKLTTGSLTLNNSCTEGDEINVLVTRNHNIASDAAGSIRLFPSKIHEN